jgi:hypothetical protein
VIISLHTPKTAGLSFKKVLKDHFKEKLIEEYIDLPLIHSLEDRKKSAFKSRLLFNLYRRLNFERKGYQCIHGHFLPYKFTGPAAIDIQYITWLRDPLERMCSHYYYWLRTYREGISPALQTRIIKENWTLEEFCLSSEMRNVYQQYLWRFPVEKFNFIGITDYFNEDIKYFSKYFLGNKQPDLPYINANPERKTEFYDMGSEMIAKIRKFHSRDYEIYEHALQKREQRIKNLII